MKQGRRRTIGLLSLILAISMVLNAGATDINNMKD